MNSLNLKNIFLSRKFWLFLGISLISLIFFFGIFNITDARAGGGGRGSCDSWWCILMYPIAIISSLIVSWIAGKKMKAASKILSKISQKDSVWDENFIESRASNAFYKIQEAWTKNDPELSKDFMTDRLYNKHKAQIESMINAGERNVLEQINLNKCEVVEVKDFKNNLRDRVGVFMEGTMVDYMIDKDNKILDKKGEKLKEPRGFREIWYFNRINDNWYADEIDSEVSIGDIRKVQNVVED